MPSCFRAHRRATAFLFAVTLLAVATKGLCLMPAAGGGIADAHACCTRGTETLVPGCCMNAQADPNAATATARVPAPMPAVATLSPMGADSPFVPAPPFVFGAHRQHAPLPKPILRV
jgi:hypothetical protein